MESKTFRKFKKWERKRIESPYRKKGLTKKEKELIREVIKERRLNHARL